MMACGICRGAFRVPAPTETAIACPYCGVALRIPQLRLQPATSVPMGPPGLLTFLEPHVVNAPTASTPPDADTLATLQRRRLRRKMANWLIGMTIVAGVMVVVLSFAAQIHWQALPAWRARGFEQFAEGVREDVRVAAKPRVIRHSDGTYAKVEKTIFNYRYHLNDEAGTTTGRIHYEQQVRSTTDHLSRRLAHRDRQYVLTTGVPIKVDRFYQWDGVTWREIESP